jgi:sporulation protein YlmC with PRC-barrel domain
MKHLDLMREVLDQEIVDIDGVACGTVDDLEFHDTPQGPVVAALLVGPGAWMTRLPALLRVLARPLFGTGCVRVPWSQVREVDEQVKLAAKAGTLGLGVLDRKVGAWLRRLPKS